MYTKLFSTRSTFYTLVVLGLLTLPAYALASDVFVPLTGLPGIETVNGDGRFSDFLNSLYRLCVGAAAVLAVIQITRAGVVYMLQDSFTEKAEAKKLIQMSIFGLLLVLAPTVVFNLIDPRILNLSLDVRGLQPTPVSTSAPVGATCESFNIQNGQAVFDDFGIDCCEKKGWQVETRSGKGDNRFCVQELTVITPTEEETAGSSGRTADGRYYRNIPIPSGAVYIGSAYKDPGGEACIQLAFETYQDKEKCDAELVTLGKSSKDWKVSSACFDKGALRLGRDPNGEYLPVETVKKTCDAILPIP